ncbi:MAG: PIN domain-containing protein [Acidimicrobiaceae bacterium]|nr:PIN domain-containing protein [Acidimicrobiaceae bacterium]MDE0320051.1 PIN domain-containing protein [Acidimicrobiaceae bacterium]
MIYLDTSVVLAHLLGEDLQPPASIWEAELVSSRLVEYELWTRLNSAALGEAYDDAAQALLGRLALVELSPVVLARALQPFPGASAVRTLDALHLATCDYLRNNSRRIELATYDRRMRATASAMGVPLLDLDDVP